MAGCYTFSCDHCGFSVDWWEDGNRYLEWPIHASQPSSPSSKPAVACRSPSAIISLPSYQAWSSCRSVGLLN